MSRWGRVATSYRESFATLCAGTLDEVLDAVPEGRLLDAGCGCGDLVVRAAGAGREVVGIDADPDMVAMTAVAAPAPVVQSALPELPFPDSTFDAVAANFVVNHLSDPRAGVQELARLTRPGGTLVATIWPAGGSDWQRLVSACSEAAGAVPRPATRLPQHLDFERTSAGLADLCAQTDLSVCRAEDLTWHWVVAPEALWAGIAGGVAGAGQTYLAQSPGIRAHVEEEFRARSEAATVDGRLRLTARAVLVVATR